MGVDFSRSLLLGSNMSFRFSKQNTKTFYPIIRTQTPSHRIEEQLIKFQTKNHNSSHVYTSFTNYQNHLTQRRSLVAHPGIHSNLLHSKLRSASCHTANTRGMLYAKTIYKYNQFSTGHRKTGTRSHPVQITSQAYTTRKQPTKFQLGSAHTS